MKFSSSTFDEHATEVVASALPSSSCCRCLQEPKQLNALFEKNYNLLLSIFNPDGWLDITFVDEQHRLGRDDKGNVFLLERVQ